LAPPFDGDGAGWTGSSGDRFARRFTPREVCIASRWGIFTWRSVRLETLRRIVAVIPNLKRVTLGGMEIVTANADLEEARRAALDLFDVAKRLMSALGASPAPVPPHNAGQKKVVAVHPDGATKSERETARRLEAEVERNRRRPRRDA
jgi:hypothetical protein